jgi:integrase/recombinase XerD
VAETVEDAGITKQAHPHWLCHTIATRLVNRGVPLEHIGKVLGHDGIDTTRIHAKT